MFILIWISVLGSPGIGSAEFGDEAACRAAATVIQRSGVQVKTFCMPKATPQELAK